MALILITDGEQRAALAAARSLGQAGHTVLVTSPRERSLAGASRYTSRQLRTPDPLKEPDSFVDAVRSVVREHRVEVLLPISEASLLAILPARDRFEEAVIPFPSERQFTAICDKARLTEVARGLGIGIPSQRRVERPEDVARLVVPEDSFPLVAKPARSIIQVDGARAKSSVIHLANGSELRRALGSLPPDAFPVLLQERIVGPGIGVFLLLWEGEVLASFFHRRIREKPPSGGVSVYRESKAPDASLLRLSIDLLRAFDWEGVAMVEYKVDEATGRPYLMEINGRFWGSLQLAIDAGVDFPRLLVEAALGGHPAPTHTYREGVRSRWWWGDVDHLIARLRRSREELSLPAETPGRLSAMLDFLRASAGGSRNEVFRPLDPGPAIRETIDWFSGR